MFKNILRMSTGGSGAADLRYHVAEKRVAEEADTAVRWLASDTRP